LKSGTKNKTEFIKKANTKIIPTSTAYKHNKQHNKQNAENYNTKKINIQTQQRCKQQKNNLKHKIIQKIQLSDTKYKNNTIITQTIIHPLPHPLAPLSFSPPFTITQSLTLLRAFTLPPRVINNSHTAVCPFIAA